MPKRKPYRHTLAMVGGNGLLKSLVRTFEVVRERWTKVEARNPGISGTLLADELMKLMRYLVKFCIEPGNMLHPSLSFYNGLCFIPST